MNDDVLTPWFRIIEAAVQPPPDTHSPERHAALEVIRNLRSAGYAIVPAKPGNVVDGHFSAGPRVVYDAEGAEPSVGTPGHAVIDLLQQALTDARCGNLTFVALTGITVRGDVQPAWAGEYKPLTCLAAVTDLRLRFEKAYMEATAEDAAE